MAPLAAASLVFLAPIVAQAISGAGDSRPSAAPDAASADAQPVTVTRAGSHWHGATATTGMSHYAIQEALDGKSVEWLEKVSDEQYLAGSSAE